MNTDSLSVIKLTGELEIARRDELKKALTLQGNPRGLLLDLSEVTYADSSALSELLRLRAQAEAAGVPIALVIVNQQFRRLIEYAGLGQLFQIYSERGPALTYLSSAKIP